MKEAFWFALLFAIGVELLGDGCTNIASRIAVLAASRLPRKHRRRWHEEWLADLQTRPRLLRPLFALDLFRASFLIRREYIVIAFAKRGWKPQFTTSPDLLAKRAFNICFALIALVSFAPALLVSTALIRLTTGGPAVVGEFCFDAKGRRFELYRFNIYDRQGTPTRVGRFLYRTRYDRLPGLFNVLNGSLSLVGVRPFTLATDNVRLQLLRTRSAATRPGLIVNGDSLDGIGEDLDYVQRWSILLDLRLLLTGMRRLLSGRGRPPPPIAGKTKRPLPVIGRSSRRIATACLESGTICASPIFMRSAGILHSGSGHSNENSDHSAARSSPGRTKT